MMFCVLNSVGFPCPRTHMFHVRKLAEGFIQRGYHYKELNAINDIQYLKESDVLYVSNHFSSDIMHRSLSGWLQGKLIRALQGTSAKLILWNFHTVPDSTVLHSLAQSVVHLGEDLYPEAIAAEPNLYDFRKEFKVLSLKYSSSMHPNFPNNVAVERDLDFNFVGNGYQDLLTNHCSSNYNSFIRNTPPSINEPLRVNSFRRAEINLVFHAPNNIKKGIVVERFAEALSLGGIVFHDHPRILKDFPSHPSLFFVNSTNDIDVFYSQVISLTKSAREELRKTSWETWKSSDLSYFSQAGFILNALN